MALWVMRRAGRRSGAPESTYEEQAFLARLPELSRRLFRANQQGKRELLDYDTPAGGHATDLHFYVHEAFHGRRVRQGWGVPELALSREDGVAKAPEDWIIDYLFAIWKYWGDIEIEATRGSAAEVGTRLAPFARQASGRYWILSRMLRMSAGDVLLIPATSAVVGRENGFSVGTVRAQYRFSLVPDAPRSTFLRDYGHVIEVGDLRTVEYSSQTLAGSDFRAYRYAVNGPITGAHGDRYADCLRRLGYDP